MIIEPKMYSNDFIYMYFIICMYMENPKLTKYYNTK